MDEDLRGFQSKVSQEYVRSEDFEDLFGAAAGRSRAVREGRRGLAPDYTTTGTRDLDEAEGRLKHLDLFFAARRLAWIGQADTARYAEQRQGEGASNGTINRELAVLGRMCRIAHEGGELFRLPVLRKLYAGVPERVAMKVTGHKTRAVFAATCRTWRDRWRARFRARRGRLGLTAAP